MEGGIPMMMRLTAKLLLKQMKNFTRQDYLHVSHLWLYLNCNTHNVIVNWYHDYPVCVCVQRCKFIWLISTGIFTHSCPRIYGRMAEFVSSKKCCWLKSAPLPTPTSPPAIVLRRFIPLTPLSEPFLQPAKRLTAVFQIKRLLRVCEERSFFFLWNITEGKEKRGVQFDIGHGGLDCSSAISRRHLNCFWYSAVKKSQQLHWFHPLAPHPPPLPPPPPSPVVDLFK